MKNKTATTGGLKTKAATTSSLKNMVATTARRPPHAGGPNKGGLNTTMPPSARALSQSQEPLPRARAKC